MKKTKYLKLLAVFVAVLIISLPISFAQSLSITQNTGKDNAQVGDKGYLRSFSDTWTLQVNAVTGQSISPSQLKVNNFQFDSCTQGVSGYDCIYKFDYTSASTPEATYAVTIDLYDTSNQLVKTKKTTVTADGSPPSISSLNIYQSATQVKVDLTVQDQGPADCAGIGKIEIYDVGSNTLLHTLSGQSLASQITSKCGSNQLSIPVAFPAAGNLSKTGKVIVYDAVNNQRTATKSFTYDYNLPSVISASLQVGDFGGYAPSGSRLVNVSLDVSEDGSTLTAKASSSDLGWSNENAVCTKTDLVNDIFTCVWQKNVNFGSSTTLSVTVSDGANTVTQSVSKSFTIDSTPPSIDLFTVGEFEGQHYLAPNNNKVKIVFEEAQSGIDASSVKADLSEINIYKSTQTPADNCTKTGTKHTCYWYNIDNAQAGTIYLVNAQDKVGNQVTSSNTQTDLIMDNTNPIISNVEVYALGTEGQVDFYQSRDILKISYFVEELHGVDGQVDLDDVVTDFTGVSNENGIISAACTETDTENLYKCTALTPRIKSGPDSTAEIKIFASDVAGNIAEKTETFEILGVENEPNPDFWSISSVGRSPDGLDITTVPYLPQRVFYPISLNRKTSSVQLLGMSLDQCTGDTDKLNSQFMINNMFGSTNPYLVLEVSPYSPDQDLNFNCTLNIFSRRSDKAISNPEQESIVVSIPFYRTQFDSNQERLDELIRQEKHRAQYGLFGTIGVLKEIVFWAKISCNTLGLWPFLKFTFDVINTKGDALRSYPATVPTAIALCYGTSTIKDEGGLTVYKALDKFCQVISCEKGILSTLGGPDTLDKWSTGVDTYYSGLGSPEYAKIKKGFNLNTDPYNNIYMAVAKLCVPAIIWNLDKVRQVQCRYVSCLENEAKAGVTTISGCRELRAYQNCKYFLGEFFAVLPVLDIVNGILHQLQNFLKDPVGLLGLGLSLLCKNNCGASNAGQVLCSISAWIMAFAQLANQILSIVNQGMNLRADYCSQVGLNPF